MPRTLTVAALCAVALVGCGNPEADREAAAREAEEARLEALEAQRSAVPAEAKLARFHEVADAAKRAEEACNAVPGFEFVGHYLHAESRCTTSAEAALIAAAQQEDDRAVAQALEAVGGFEELLHDLHRAEAEQSRLAQARFNAFADFRKVCGADADFREDFCETADGRFLVVTGDARYEVSKAAEDAYEAVRSKVEAACEAAGGVLRGFPNLQCTAPTRYEP